MKKLKFLLLFIITFTMITVNTSANEDTGYIFEDIGVYSEGMAAAGVWGHEWQYGYIDSSAKLVIKPEYKVAGRFSAGIASVGVDGSGNRTKYGFINKDGSYLIEPKFDETGDFHKIPSTGTEVAMVGVGEQRSGRKYGFVQKDGTYFVSPQFDGVSAYWT
ncbi:MAG TPA: WG repeat-containing protein, partial [Candidatus Nitrosocosmicus sp.]|nr:WG repeat-containing protein [Candidatus Nitrosocosmicus sp.]